MVSLQVMFLSLLSLSVASYVPTKKLVKPGMCPKIIGRIAGNCISDCINDEECPGDKKCCRINECATSCKMPSIFDAGSISSSAILDDRNTVFGVQSSLSGIRKSGQGIRADNVGSSRRFTGGRTSKSFNSGIKGKSSTIIGNQRGRSGFGDTGFAGGRIGSADTFDLQRESGFAGGRMGSVDTFDLQRESGFGGIRSSHGKTKSILRKLNGGTLIRDRSFIGTSAGGMTSKDCQYECGKTKPCPVGKICVQDGCHNICKIDISLTNKRVGLLEDNMGGNIRTSQGGEFGTGRSSFQRSSSILDGISGRSSGLTGSQTGVIGLTKGGSKKMCRKQCEVDGDCHGGKICVINGCHQYCRRGPVKNNYQP